MAKREKGSGKRDLFEIQHKLWLEKNGAIFGDGLYKLLTNVSALGSISQAAREMGMSYRAAWGKIKTAEGRWGLSLVITQVGGDMGGGTKLTPEAEELLRRYQIMRTNVDLFVKKSFEEIFQGWPGL